MKHGFKIFLTIAYSAFWFALLFLVVGFFMIKPVAFYNKISGKGSNNSNNKPIPTYTVYESSIHDHSGDSTDDENVEQTSKYGYSDDPIEDEVMFNDDMDED